MALRHDPRGEKGKEHAWDLWHLFNQLIQTIWDKGEILRQMMWRVVVLLPKGGGDFCGIGRLGSFWEVIKVLMDKHLAYIEFHDCLHGFLSVRGMGNAPTKVKLTQ